MDLLTNGNSYIQIVRNGNGRVVQLLPLNYDDVDIYVLENKLYYSDKNIKENIESENMLHFKLITANSVKHLTLLK